jgi:catechol 2,3-dioxygenase-like lactoylglutathione lyase family enzyme
MSTPNQTGHIGEIHRVGASRVACRTVSVVDHLAIPVRDQERSRRFYEPYFGFGARPARRYDDGVLMLYNAAGFALGLGPGVGDCPAVVDALRHRAARP